VSACVRELEHANTCAHCQRTRVYAVRVCVHTRIQNPSSETYRQSSLRSFARWYVCQAFSLHKRLRISARSSISSHPPRTPIHHIPAASRDAPHARCTVLHAPPTSRRTRSPEFCATSIILRRAPTAHFRDWHTHSLHTLALAASSGDHPPLTSQGLAAARPPRSSQRRARGICARSVATSVMYTCVRVSISCLYTKQMHAYEQAHVSLCRPVCRWLLICACAHVFVGTHRQQYIIIKTGAICLLCFDFFVGERTTKT
jgi:hypothetical protein